MAARITAAQARKLGIEAPAGKVRTRKTAKGPYRTVCCACETEFHTEASETRHLNETGHGRYRLVLGLA